MGHHTPQLKKHLRRRCSHRFNRALCTIHIISAPHALSLSCLSQGKTSSGWPQTQMARSLTQISFHNREWGMGGGGNPPSPGEIRLSLLTESVVITLLSQPASLAMLIGMCNGLLIGYNLGARLRGVSGVGGLARGWGLLGYCQEGLGVWLWCLLCKMMMS